VDDAWFTVYGLWCMVYGAWFMVHGSWFMVYGLWFIVYCLWFMVHISWFMIYGLRFMVCGLWFMAYALWFMAPDFDLGFHVKVLDTLQVIPSSLGSGVRGIHTYMRLVRGISTCMEGYIYLCAIRS